VSSLHSPAVSRSSGAAARPTTDNIVSFEDAKDMIAAISRVSGSGPVISSGMASSGSIAGVKPLTLVDNQERGTLCVGLSEVEVNSVEQVTWLLKRAEDR
jgi:hypothetical protein